VVAGVAGAVEAAEAVVVLEAQAAGTTVSGMDKVDRCTDRSDR